MTKSDRMDKIIKKGTISNRKFLNRDSSLYASNFNQLANPNTHDLRNSKELGKGAFASAYVLNGEPNRVVKIHSDNITTREVLAEVTAIDYLKKQIENRDDGQELKKYVLTYDTNYLRGSIESDLKENGSLIGLIKNLYLNDSESRAKNPDLFDAFEHDPAGVLMVFADRMLQCVNAMNDLGVVWRDGALRNYLVGEFKEQDFIRGPDGKAISLNDAPIVASDFGLSLPIVTQNSILTTKNEEMLPRLNLPNDGVEAQGGENEERKYHVMSDMFIFKTALIDMIAVATGENENAFLTSKGNNHDRLLNNIKAAQDHLNKLSDPNNYRDDNKAHMEFNRKCAEGCKHFLAIMGEYLEHYPTLNPKTNPSAAKKKDLMLFDAALKKELGVQYSPVSEEHKSREQHKTESKQFISDLKKIIDETVNDNSSELMRQLKTTLENIKNLEPAQQIRQLNELVNRQNSHYKQDKNMSFTPEQSAFFDLVKNINKNTPEQNYSNLRMLQTAIVNADQAISKENVKPVEVEAELPVSNYRRRS